MKTVTYVTTSKLSCDCNSEVIVCVPTALTVGATPFVYATLSQVMTSSTDSCGKQVYKYYLEYAENVLVDPTRGLFSIDISGVLCKGCLTSYIDSKTIYAHTECSTLVQGANNPLIDDAIAINAAIASRVMPGTAYPQGEVLLCGTYYTQTPITVTSGAGLHLKGEGTDACQINFNPSVSGTAAIQFIGGGQCSAEGITIAGLGTKQKIGILLDNVDDSYVQDIYVGPSFTGNNGNAATPSIGLKVTGHGSSVNRRCTFNADLPVQLTNSIDHFHFADLYLIAGSHNYCVEVTDGCALSNVTFDGFQAWAGGLGGLYWDDTTSAGSINVAIKNVRYEQAVGTTGWVMYISNHTALNNLVLENIWGGVTINGVYLKKVNSATLQNVSPLTPPLYTSLSLDTIEVVNTIDCGFGTVTLAANVAEIFAHNRASWDSTFKCTSYQKVRANCYDSVRLQGQTYYGLSGTILGTGAIVTIPTANINCYLAFVSAEKSDHSASAGGVVLVSGTTATLVAGTANFKASDVAGNFCFIGGGVNINLRNYLAPMNYTVTIIGTPV